LKLPIKPETLAAVYDSVESCEHLSALVEGANPNLGAADFGDITVSEQDYIWLNIVWQ
jgi:hypothetical protein